MMRSLTLNFIRLKAIAGIFRLEKLVKSAVSQKFLPLYFNFFSVADEKEVKKEKPKEEPSSHFQRQRVDMLLGELMRKFPIPQNPAQEQTSKVDDEKIGSKSDAKAEATVTIKQEPMDTNDIVTLQQTIKQEPISGPPEKKSKLNNN